MVFQAAKKGHAAELLTSGRQEEKVNLLSGGKTLRLALPARSIIAA